MSLPSILAGSASRARALLTVVALCSFLPFINRPVWFDDHAIFREVLDVAAAKNPLPFGQVAHEAGWVPGSVPTEANPPAFAYLVGTLARVVGTEFWKSHLFLLVFQIGGLLVFFELARRFTAHPSWASVLLLFSPAYFLTAYSLLVDGLLIPAICGAVWAWIKGEETDRPAWFFLAAVLAGAAALVKYTGVIAGGLILWRIFVGPRPAALRRALWLAVPAAIFAAWALFTKSLYGESHFGAVARESVRAPEATRLFLLASFAAATLPSIPLSLGGFFTEGTARSRLIGGALIFGGGGFGWALLPGGYGIALGLAAGAFAAWTIAAVSRFRPGSGTTFLLVWLVAALAGLSIARGWICARYLVVAAPAIVLLSARHLERFGSRFRWSAAVVSAALTLSLAHADTRRAMVERDGGGALNRWVSERPGTRAFYPAATPTGLGFYLDPSLWKPIEAGAPLSDGDVVVAPIQTLPARFLPRHPHLAPEAEFVYTTVNPLRLLDRGSLAGFYGSVWGPMPFSVSTAPLERFVVFRAQSRAAE